MKISKNELEKIHVKQLGEFACGIACLSSICKFHGKDVTQEEIRGMSGTTFGGTTLLGLYQAAKLLKFEADGLEASIDHLRTLDHPVILHVIIDDTQEHFVVFYGMQNGNYLISDPAWGIVEYSEKDFLSIWKSGYLLSLKPSAEFVTSKSRDHEMRSWFKLLIWEDIPVLVVAAVLGIIIATLSLSTAIFAQKLIDELLPEHAYGKIWVGFLALAVLLSARALLGYLRNVMMARQGSNLSVRIAQSFVTKLLRLPISFIKGYSVGDLVARLNDSMRIRATVTLITGEVLINCLIVIAACLYIFSMSLLLGAVSLFSVALFYFVGWKFSAMILLRQKELMRANAANESQYIDALSGLSVIKSYNREESFENRVTSINKLFQQKGYVLEVLSARFGLFTQLLAGLYGTVLFGIGVWQVINDGLLLGELMALVTVGGSMMPALGGLIMSNVTIQGALVAFQRMHEVSSIDPEVEGTETTIPDTKNNKQKIQVVNLSFRFPGQQHILHNINLVIAKGQVNALFGKIGSGKSTFVDLMQRFHHPESGSILMHNIDSNAWPVAAWRANIGIVRQDEKLFNSTVLDNICLSNDPNEVDESVRYLKDIGFENFFNDFPQGYATLCGENGLYLSGGQKQLVTLARALNKRPDFLVLDESTSAMDFEKEIEVLRTLKHLATENFFGIMMVTHRGDLARMLGHIYVLENGSITASGTHETLLLTKNLYSNYHDQFVNHVM